MERPAPEFVVGQLVRVALNERNRTPRVGRVRLLTWHFKLSRWMFFLEVNRTRASKRYFADDLVAEPRDDLTEFPSPPVRDQ